MATIVKRQIICFAVVAILINYSITNKCFIDRTSEDCLQFIALQRNITRVEALKLRARALNIYSHEETQHSAIYDQLTVAVSCLASPISLRPGPDSDCAACGQACTQESRPEVCELYCEPPPISKQEKLNIERMEENIGFKIKIYNTSNESQTPSTTGGYKQKNLVKLLLCSLISLMVFLISSGLFSIWMKFGIIDKPLKVPTSGEKEFKILFIYGISSTIL